MKLISTVLFILSLNAYSQTAQWTTGKEDYVVRYIVQESKDQITWDDLLPVAPLKNEINSYSCKLSLASNYYRIKAEMVNGIFYTKSIKVTTTVNAGQDEIIQLPINNITFSGSISQTTN